MYACMYVCMYVYNHSASTFRFIYRDLHAPMHLCIHSHMLQGQGQNKDTDVRKHAADVLLICGELWQVERLLWLKNKEDPRHESYFTKLQVCSVCECRYNPCVRMHVHYMYVGQSS